MTTPPLLEAHGLKIAATVKHPGEKPRQIEIVHGIDFTLEKGKVLGPSESPVPANQRLGSHR